MTDLARPRLTSPGDLAPGEVAGEVNLPDRSLMPDQLLVGECPDCGAHIDNPPKHRARCAEVEAMLAEWRTAREHERESAALTHQLVTDGFAAQSSAAKRSAR